MSSREQRQLLREADADGVEHGAHRSRVVTDGRKIDDPGEAQLGDLVGQALDRQDRIKRRGAEIDRHRTLAQQLRRGELLDEQVGVADRQHAGDRGRTHDAEPAGAEGEDEIGTALLRRLAENAGADRRADEELAALAGFGEPLPNPLPRRFGGGLHDGRFSQARRRRR